jgi:hypothetical protein
MGSMFYVLAGILEIHKVLFELYTKYGLYDNLSIRLQFMAILVIPPFDIRLTMEFDTCKFNSISIFDLYKPVCSTERS